MDTCEFCYISNQTHLLVRAWGIERSWDDLKIEFGRSGAGLPGATYYKRTSPQGPQLFAVVNEDQVFYHDKGIWQRYITATDVKFGTISETEGQKGEYSGESEEKYGVADS